MGWQGSDRNAASTNTVSRFETETLTQQDNLQGLARMNPQWVEDAMAHTPHQRVILDMDSSESPVHGQQEGAAYNGHFECVCYHPLFLFNQFGDCEGATLRPGNVHSADGWQELLEPVVKRYQRKAGAIRVSGTRKDRARHPASRQSGDSRADPTLAGASYRMAVPGAYRLLP